MSTDPLKFSRTERRANGRVVLWTKRSEAKARRSPVCAWSRAVLLMLAAFFFTHRGAALTNDDLVVRAWSQGPDVRQQSVGALLQTRDGYLWLGTARGLMRFDGVSFTAFSTDNTQGTVDDYIGAFALWEDPAGVIWAGTESNGVIRNDHGSFSTLGANQGLSSGPIRRIDGDESGAVWIFTDNAVYRRYGQQLQQVHPERDGASSGAAMLTSSAISGDFRSMGLWRRNSSGLQRFAYGHWADFSMPPDYHKLLEHDVRSIYEDRLHRVWYSVLSRPGDYFCFCNGSLRIYKGLPKTAFVSYEDRSGFLWLNVQGASNARWRDGKLYPLPEIKSPRFLRIVEQADGTLWVGSPGTPLFQYTIPLISTLRTSGIPEFSSVLFQQRRGDVWAGATDLLHLQQTPDGPRLEPWFAKQRRRPLMLAMSEDREGDLLMSSSDRPGIVVLRGRRQNPYLPGIFARSTVRAMLLSSSGIQWIGTDTGLYQYGGTAASNVVRIWGGEVSCLLEADAHTMWVGTPKGPLRFVDGRQQTVSAHPGWNFGTIQSMTLDQHGDLWMATFASGIVRLARREYRTVSTADGLPTNDIGGVDSSGDELWLRSDVGLIRLRGESIERRWSDPANKLQIRAFNQTEGLPAPNTSSGNQEFLQVDRDTLWFATPGGIASLHPTELQQSNGSPHAVLEEHAIDQGDRIAGSSIVLQRNQSNLELHYTALGARRPEQVTFRYKLTGFDPSWIAAGTRRAAYYTHLPPGRYTFEVQAADGDGELWEATGAQADVRVVTPLYRTWWMESLLFMLLSGGLIFLFKTRHAVQSERNRMRQAFTHRLIASQESERKRIAHELHDSLGQHLVLIRTLALLPTARAAAASEHLTKIADQSAVAIQEIESISYDLRPYQLDRLGLTRTILSLIEQFEDNSSVHVTRSVENIDGFFPKHLEINVYRIIQEAFANILKHSGATEVVIAIARSSRSLQIVIEDNGRGLPGTASGQGQSGLGLVGIQERAEALGGHAVIASTDSHGTSVAVHVMGTA